MEINYEMGTRMGARMGMAESSAFHSHGKENKRKIQTL
jgi:hypothetical protein